MNATWFGTRTTCVYTGLITDQWQWLLRDLGTKETKLLWLCQRPGATIETVALALRIPPVMVRWRVSQLLIRLREERQYGHKVGAMLRAAIAREPAIPRKSPAAIQKERQLC